VSDASINTYIEENNIFIKDYGVIKRDLDPSRIIYNTEQEEFIPVFRIAGTATKSLSNLVSTRSRIYRALRVKNDIEAYRKLLELYEAVVSG